MILLGALNQSFNSGESCELLPKKLQRIVAQLVKYETSCKGRNIKYIN